MSVLHIWGSGPDGILMVDAQYAQLTDKVQPTRHDYLPHDGTDRRRSFSRAAAS
jgi:hypothetical protein